MRKVHFLGIAGSGTSAAAHIAQSQGFIITGCDNDFDSEFISGFEENQLFRGHNPDHLRDVDILAVTPAVYSLDPENPELKEAERRGIEVLSWQEFVGQYLTTDKFVIAICGTHGKSTTTAMVGTILEDANLNPTVLLGAKVHKWGSNFRIGNSRYFVIEADEFNNNYFSIKPDLTIVTNLEFDHPEFFKDFEEYKQSFIDFLSKTSHSIIANISDPAVSDVIKVVMKKSSVNVLDYSKNNLGIELKVLGDHNKLNASAAFQAMLQLGLDPMTIRNSLTNFGGISRRFEKIGEFRGAQIYSDFAHHPTEVETTITQVKKKYKDVRIVLVFQPHMFSRTKALFTDFVSVFQKLEIDQLFILDIYPSREKDTGLIDSRQLVEAIGKRAVSYLGRIKDAQNFLKVAIRKGDLVIFMGAGDIDKLARKLCNPE